MWAQCRFYEKYSHQNLRYRRVNNHARKHESSQSDSLKIKIEYDTKNAKRSINITKLYIGLGQALCVSLPGFHAQPGCDYNTIIFPKRPYRAFKNIDGK